MNTTGLGENTRIALEDIAAERARQINELGFTPELDKLRDDNDLGSAAIWYALSPKGRDRLTALLSDSDLYTDTMWPFAPETFKPGNRLRDLAKAGALIAAEYERLWSIRHDHITDVVRVVEPEGSDNWEEWKHTFKRACYADGWVNPLAIEQTDWDAVHDDAFLAGESAIEAYKDYHYER